MTANKAIDSKTTLETIFKSGLSIVNNMFRCEKCQKEDFRLIDETRFYDRKHIVVGCSNCGQIGDVVYREIKTDIAAV